MVPTRMVQISPKFVLALLFVEETAGKLKAIKLLAEMTGMGLEQARYFVEQLPQDLALPACETFKAAIMTQIEIDEVKSRLEGVFRFTVRPAENNVLPYGMTATPPWVKSPVPPTASCPA